MCFYMYFLIYIDLFYVCIGLNSIYIYIDYMYIKGIELIEFYIRIYLFYLFLFIYVIYVVYM